MSNLNRVLFFSSDAISMMGDDDLRRSIGRLRDTLRRTEESRDFDAASEVQIELCYLLREREIRIARTEAHNRYLQIMQSRGFTADEV